MYMHGNEKCIIVGVALYMENTQYTLVSSTYVIALTRYRFGSFATHSLAQDRVPPKITATYSNVFVSELAPGVFFKHLHRHVALEGIITRRLVMDNWTTLFCLHQ